MEYLRLYKPPAIAGTNNISFSYEQTLTALSAAGDSPIMPPTFHRVIAYMAAIRLRASRDMEVPVTLQQDVLDGRRAWLAHASDPTMDLDHSVISRAWNTNSYNFATRTGFYTRP